MHHAAAVGNGGAASGWLAPRDAAASGTRAEDVQRVLDSVDRSIRNFAILMLIARPGLRPIEVARLELRDVDWRGTRSRIGLD